MVIVADLGGGTLDMYAALYEGGTEPKAKSAESAQIGGKWCTKIIKNSDPFAWDVDTDTKTATAYDRAIRRGLSGPQRDDVLRNAPLVKEYFDIVRRYIVLWVEALQERWDLPAEATPVYVTLCGLGWSLPGGFKDDLSAANGLKATAKTIGKERSGSQRSANISVLQFEESITQRADVTGSGRKTFLAHTCVSQPQPGLKFAQLEEKIKNLDLVLGTPLQTQGGGVQPASARLPDQHADWDPRAADFDAGYVKDLVPGIDPQGRYHSKNVLIDAKRQLGLPRTEANHDGAFSEEGGLLRSPLTVLAEQAIQAIIGG
jgi:hypothetical protein